ncbi:glycosyltransferase [Halomonas borealis]|uniref:glycosyltransferase n=1 Tax=Halomonas borealis TaxID=2508710 RepID=UPI0010A0B448|nr:glycosyltransferase [Halomonas borealis]
MMRDDTTKGVSTSEGTPSSGDRQGSDYRVLFITDHLGGGGAPLSILGLADALARRGCHVTLLVLADKVWHEIPAGVSVVRLPFQYQGVWQKLRRYHLHARLLDRWVSAQPSSFDLVVANLHYSHQVVNRSLLADRAWLCIRTDPTVALLGSGKARWRSLRKMRWLYHRRRVIAISRGILDSLAHHGVVPHDAQLIYNVIDVEAIRRRMTDTIPHQDFIVYVGRLAMRQKRYDRLLRAYKASGVSQPLVIVGDGEVDEAKALVRSLEVEERVIFLGKQANPYPYIHRARLLVLSSDYEGFGRVIAEALVCGTPVVSTDCPSGPCEILQGELAGCLVEPDDGPLLGEKIREVLASPPVIEEAHYRAFLPETIAARYLRLCADG